jgi:hypothetical protein
MTLKKKSYSPPALTERTREQAIKLVAERKNCNEDEVAEFLQPPRKRRKKDATD